MRIGFIGFGEAGRAFADSLAEADPELTFSSYDILLDGDAAGSMRAAMTGRGVAVAETAAGLASADWIVSAVTADASLDVIEALRPHLSAGQLVIDINSVSPERKRESARRVVASGAVYLDMAVMAPVHPRGHRTPVLVAGPGVPGLARLGFDFRVVGPEPGAATAIKMVRSLFVKGLEAITVETLLAAEASGCLEEILASLSGSFPGLGWPDFAAYQFERTLRHGARRAAEMTESAATVDALGLRGGLAAEIAAVQARMGAAGPVPAQDLAASVAEALRRRRAGEGA